MDRFKTSKTGLDNLPQRVQRVLSDIGRHTGHGGVYYSLENDGAPVIGDSVCRFCHGCLSKIRDGAFCRHNACTGAVQGHAIGDVWYFRCWLGLDSLVVPVAPQGAVIGSIEIGGFFSPGDSENAQRTVLSRLSSLNTGTLDLFVSSLQALRELNFKQVKALADFLLETTFAAGLNDASAFLVRRKINQQQQRLAQKVEELQRGHQPGGEVFDSLSNLRQALARSDRAQLMQALDDFLGHVLLSAQGDLKTAHAGLQILLSVLFFRCVQNGMRWTMAKSLFDQRLLELEKTVDIESACFWAEDLALQQLDETLQKTIGGGQPCLSDRILGWLQLHYNRKVAIADAARELGASPSTVVHKLKKETGKSFTHHLNAIRVSEAKRLLVDSNLALRDIGERCGFSDQSYFTKVFRKHINLTPREFRSMLD